MKKSHYPRILISDHLPSGSPNGQSHDELRTRYACSTGGLDGSPDGRLLDTLGQGEPPSFKGNQSAATGGSAGSAKRGAQRVQNIGDNSSAPRRQSRSKWSKIDWLRLNSTIKAQRSCLLGTRGGSVGVRVSSAGAGYSGLMHCARIACPNCGPRLGAARREDINASITRWRADSGQVYFGTLTLRHHQGQSFKELSDALAGCWGAATGGRGWVADRRRFGVAHSLRVWEEKWSIANGWHVHVHFLLYVEPSADNSAESISGLLASMFTRWSAKAKSLGLGSPRMKGQDLHLVTGEDLDSLGGYFAKQVTEDSADTAESMAWEMSNPNGKERGDSFTPAEILDLAVGGDPTMQALWAEYEQGMIKRRTIAWSRGLRDAVGLDEEQTDQEIADEDLGGETVLSMSAKTWWKFSRQDGARRELLDIVSARGAAGAIDWLRDSGFHAVLGEWVGDE